MRTSCSGSARAHGDEAQRARRRRRPPAPRARRARRARARRASTRGPRPDGREGRAPPSSRPGRRPASSPRAGSRRARSARRSAPACPGSPAPRRSARTRQEERSRPSSAWSGIGARTARRRSWARGRAWRAAGGSPTASARAGRGTRAATGWRAGRPVVQAEEPRSDEAHVVVQRQPARAHVGRAARRGPAAMARMLASRLSCVSSTPLGLPGAARRVLDEGGVGARALRRRPGGARGRPARRPVTTCAQRGHARPRARAATPRARSIVISARTSASARIAACRSRVLLEPVEAHRRVDRHRHRARDAGCPGRRAGSRGPVGSISATVSPAADAVARAARPRPRRPRASSRP